MATTVMGTPQSRILRQSDSADATWRVVIVGPHLDDPIFMGGQVLLHLEQGHEVFFVYVTYGDASCPEYPQEVFTQMRIEEEFKAASVIGMPQERLIFLPELYRLDHQLCGVYPPSVIEGGLYPGRLNERVVFHYLMEAFRLVQPHEVYIPYGGATGDPRRHPDHAIVSEQSLFATRFAPGKYFREYRDKGSPFSIEEKSYYEIDVPFDFRGERESLRVLDITDLWDRKIVALREYSSQNTDLFERRMIRWMEERGLPEDRKFEVFRRIES